MKQKRKVKSLISSKSDSSVLLSALLFLVGGILVFGAVALFTSSVGIASAQGEGEAFEYENGIEDKVEVLLNLKFASDGLSNTVNEMYFSGNTFYMKGNDGISRDVPAGGSIDGYVNYLGGEWDGMNISSDNVTIIGGKSVKVLENNANTTILGGLNNVVDKRNTAGSVAPVMLGGQNNKIGENQLGSAIVGGNHNTISNNGSYDFILGGENNTINGENVIVGGSKVTVNGKSNVFVFNDGETTFTPQGSNTFYLYLKNGLGLNKAAVNKGVDSKGSVSFGSISIGMLCEDEDVGVQGRWEGCLVGCTYRSATNGKKWEMIDHGDTCEEKCKDNPTRCMVDPIEPTPPADYTSECTVGGVDTNHSTQCAANRLNVYENVMFETFLIDSDDDCANYDTHQNKCIFKCDKDYHLTGNIAGGSSVTKKCYKDCTLPWNGEKIKHNVKVDAYNAKTVACSNTEWVFPLTTAIVNVPTSEYTLGLTINGMVKARVGNGEKEGHSYESCTNYTHKKTLVCYDGELYIANTNGTKTNTKALGNTGAWYGYDVCTTKDYKCPTSVYNLTQSYITTNSIAKDTVTRNNTDRSTSMGIRGQYKLCQDWTPSVGNSECKVGLNGANGTIANNYHYQLVKCNTHYSTGTDNNPYECKKSCSIKNLAGNVTRTDNNGREYKHNTVITGYKLNSELCTALGNGTCHAASIICDDGVWKMGSKAGPENTEYLYNDCKLNAYVCNSRFDISQANKNGRQSSFPHSVYEACTPYNPSGRFLCVAQTDKFDLIGCNPTDQYHTENNKYCVSNEKSVSCSGKPSNSTYYYAYRDYVWNGTWNAGGWVHTYGDCDWYCNNGYHLDGGSCSDNTETYSCYKPANSHWGTSTEVWEWFGTWDSGEMRKVQDCEWFCDDRYERVGDECVYVPEGCSSVCGPLDDGDICESYDRCDSTKLTATCEDGQMVGEQGSELSPNSRCSSCTGCPGKTYVSDGGSCTSYDQCSSTPKSATCDDGRWSGQMGSYSSPNQGCSEGCDAIGVCPATADGGTCKTYATCSATSKTITCNNGTWDGTPYDYLSANQGCASCEGCPSGTVAHNGTCTSYSTNSSCECGSYQRVSRCTNGTWSSTPYTYGSCSAPVSCGESCTICGATVAAGNSRTCWNYSSPTSPTMCDSEVRRCENGTPTGTYSEASCTQKYRSCSGCPSGTVAHNGKCESYAECSSTKITSTCTDGSWNTTPGAYSSANQNCSYSCQGSAPSNATMVAGSDQGLSSNVDRTLYANSTAAAGKKCAYLCNLSKSYYYNAGTCLYKIDWCNKNVVNGCVSPSSATNASSSNASKYTWNCSIDGTTMESGCYKCKDGYTDKGNGVCEQVDSCAGYTLTKCPDHGVCSNCPSDSSKKKLDSCMPTSCTAYCASCPSSDWLGACPANADCTTCTTYHKDGNSCVEDSLKKYKFLNCKTGFQPKDADHPYDCVSSSPVCNVNMTTACDAQVKPSGNGLCDVGSASVATSTYDPLSNYPIWVWSCTQGGTTVGGYDDGCWCRRPWAEFWIAGYGSMGLQNEQNQAWYFDIGMSVSDSFSSDVPIGIGVEYTCNNAFGGNSGTETFYQYMNNQNNGNGLTITLPCVSGGGGYQSCECSVSRARIASMPEIVQLSHGKYVAIY